MRYWCLYNLILVKQREWEREGRRKIVDVRFYYYSLLLRVFKSFNPILCVHFSCGPMFTLYNIWGARCIQTQLFPMRYHYNRNNSMPNFKLFLRIQRVSWEQEKWAKRWLYQYTYQWHIEYNVALVTASNVDAKHSIFPPSRFLFGSVVYFIL